MVFARLILTRAHAIVPHNNTWGACSAYLFDIYIYINPVYTFRFCPLEDYDDIPHEADASTNLVLGTWHIYRAD